MRDAENRLSCMDNFSTADFETILQGENGNQIISHIPRGTRIFYTSLHLTHDEGLMFYSQTTVFPTLRFVFVRMDRVSDLLLLVGNQM